MILTRTRNWMSIVYPESAPPDWQSLLAEQCVPAIVSPLHDKDINPTGEPKKAHYHVLLMFNGVKTQAQVEAVCGQFGGITPQAVQNAQSMARYFIHMDNPEKAQYSSGDIKNFSGADWSNLVKTSRDRYNALAEITEYIQEHNLYSYSDLIDYCRLNNRSWFEVCCDNTVFLRGYCKSAEWTKLNRSSHEHEYKLDSVSDRPTEFFSA